MTQGAFEMVANIVAAPDARAALSNLLRGYSVEVTSGDRKSLDDAAAMLRAGTEVFIASVPKDSSDRQALAAAHLRRAGLTPVPHLVARNFANRAELDAHLERLTGEAGVDRALVLAGDRDQPAGDLHSSLQIIESGMLQKHGIRRIAISAYPELHPRIATPLLVAARAAKLAAAERAGLEVMLLSQFCFDAEPIIELAERLREEGVRAPLRIGVAGLAGRARLLKYALMCGVGASIRALKTNQALARNVLAGESPWALMTDVARAQAANPALGVGGVHFFTFASLAATVQWAERQLQS
jgi:methylenetetrahydrofolate reductase (NADPH)